MEVYIQQTKLVGGATRVSFRHGSGIGIGYSQHASVVIVGDGIDTTAKRIEHALWNEPATGVMRRANACYRRTIEVV